MASSVAETLGLPPAYPASPTRPPKFGFYFYRGRDFHSYHNFYSMYAAARFVKAVINDTPYTWASDGEIELENDITIRAEHFTDLEKVIEHKDSKLEAQWEMGSPHTSYVRNILTGIATIEPITPRSDEDVTTITPTKPQKQKREKRPKARENTRSGITTVADLAERLSIDPRVARQALRRSNIEKPASGWEWPSEDADKIAKIIKDNLK